MNQPESRSCPSCGGTGRVWRNANNQDKIPSVCHECGGTGKVGRSPKTRSDGRGFFSDISWLAEEFTEAFSNIIKQQFGCIMLPINVARWVIYPSRGPETITNAHLVGLLLFGPLVGYLAAVGPTLIVMLVAAWPQILRDPYFWTPLPLGLPGALFGGICTFGAFGLMRLAGGDRESIFKALVGGVKLALIGGLFWCWGVGFATLNPN